MTNTNNNMSKNRADAVARDDEALDALRKQAVLWSRRDRAEKWRVTQTGSAVTVMTHDDYYSGTYTAEYEHNAFCDYVINDLHRVQQRSRNVYSWELEAAAERVAVLEAAAERGDYYDYDTEEFVPREEYEREDGDDDAYQAFERAVSHAGGTPGDLAIIAAVLA